MVPNSTANGQFIILTKMIILIIYQSKAKQNKRAKVEVLELISSEAKVYDVRNEWKTASMVLCFRVNEIYRMRFHWCKHPTLNIMSNKQPHHSLSISNTIHAYYKWNVYVRCQTFGRYDNDNTKNRTQSETEQGWV